MKFRAWKRRRELPLLHIRPSLLAFTGKIGLDALSFGYIITKKI